MILTWDENTSIEASIIDFLRTEISNSSLQLLDRDGIARNVNVYAGRSVSSAWDLPLIQVYFENIPDFNRLEIGSNKRLKSHLIVLDIRTMFPGQEINLANWVEQKINNGITIYDYTPNSLNPLVPVKTVIGHGRVDFITSTTIPSFDNADIYEQNRYRLAVKIWVNK